VRGRDSGSLTASGDLRFIGRDFSVRARSAIFSNSAGFDNVTRCGPRSSSGVRLLGGEILIEPSTDFFMAERAPLLNIVQTLLYFRHKPRVVVHQTLRASRYGHDLSQQQSSDVGHGEIHGRVRKAESGYKSALLLALVVNTGVYIH
jgi:hypothetical protein